MGDIPKSIIVILLILTVVISILGTWTVLDEVEKYNIKEGEGASMGRIRLNVLPEPGLENKEESGGSAKVSLNILEAE